MSFSNAQRSRHSSRALRHNLSWAPFTRTRCPKARCAAVYFGQSGSSSLKAGEALQVSGSVVRNLLPTTTGVGSNTTFGATSVGGSLTATSSGDIGQSANIANPLTVTGLATLNAAGNIDLGNTANDFGWKVSASGANLNLRDRNALTAILNSTGSSSLTAAGTLRIAGSVGSSLDVANSGATRLGGTLTVNGAPTTSANASVTVNGVSGAVIR